MRDILIEKHRGKLGEGVLLYQDIRVFCEILIGRIFSLFAKMPSSDY